MPTYRSDVIGSLLRPDYLKQARQQRQGQALDAAAFKRIEDRAVDEAVALQTGAGLDVDHRRRDAALCLLRALYRFGRGLRQGGRLGDPLPR